MKQRDLLELLKSKSFHFVLPFDPSKNKLVALDFTENNKTLTAEVFNDVDAFSYYIDEQLSKAGALYGIGGYGEHRTIYSRSKLFDADNEGEEPRRLHLGMDIWGKASTPLFAPMPGIVHSVGLNNRAGDYGATLILRHELNGISFHTLYGHLSLDSIRNKIEGTKIDEGNFIGELGVAKENGNWPPHLHFQVIIDMEDWKGDYPGVCKYSEQESYLMNCPDPDLIARLNRYL